MIASQTCWMCVSIQNICNDFCIWQNSCIKQTKSNKVLQMNMEKRLSDV